MCLIGLHRSWIWIESFQNADREGLQVASTENSQLEDNDDVFYLLPYEFQPPLVFILLDPQEVWEEEIFGSGLAATSKFIDEDGRGWTRQRPISDVSELKDGESLQVGGWDHEHCSLCNQHIYPEHRYFLHAREDSRFFLCFFCHDRFALTHSVGEVIYAGEGVRIDEVY